MSTAEPGAVVAVRGMAARLFEHRRWIHPPFLLAALAFGGAQPPAALAGCGLLVLHLALRLWCSRHLGGAARVHARKARKLRPLVATGPYAWCRNPLYLANLLALAGACLALGPPWLAAAALAGGLLGYASIVAWEEELLSDLHGPAYAAYREAVPRWIPRAPRGARSRVAAPSSPSIASAVSAASALPALSSWRQALRRERGSLLSSAAIAALVLLRQLAG